MRCGGFPSCRPGPPKSECAAMVGVEDRSISFFCRQSRGMKPMTDVTVDVAATSANQQVTDERREHFRLQDELRLVVSWGSDESRVEASCLNMSIGGLCFSFRAYKNLKKARKSLSQRRLRRMTFPPRLTRKSSIPVGRGRGSGRMAPFFVLSRRRSCSTVSFDGYLDLRPAPRPFTAISL